MDLSLVCEDCKAVFTAFPSVVRAIEDGDDGPMTRCDCGGPLIVVDADAKAPPPPPPALVLVCAKCGTQYDVADEGALAALVCVGTVAGRCDECEGTLYVEPPVEVVQ